MKFGIFYYDGVEPIDLATVGVLSIARRFDPSIEIITIAPKAGVVEFANGLKVHADYGFDNAPQVDALIVTGGATWVVAAKDPATLAFLKERAQCDTTLAGICTGAMVLAAAGVLEGKAATTRFLDLDMNLSPVKRMRDGYPGIDVHHKLIVDEGVVVTGGGVTLCIDLTLHLITTRMGAELGRKVAEFIEYDRAWKANKEALGEIINTPPQKLAAA